MSITDFSTLPLSDSMLKNLQELGFKSMTAVQAQSIPHILKNHDVIAQAKTGSGKTAAFGIGILNKLDIKKFRIQSLILCPTRELADQVSREMRRIARFAHNIKILTLCGGMPFGPQLGSLRHMAHIIVGTPGRVLQHLDKGSLSLENLNTLVFDEADRMLDMGFIKEINQIIKYTPEKRQTLLFSATFPAEIVKFGSSIQKDAINIQTITVEKANKITEYFYNTTPETKLNTLINVLNHHQPENVIIFCNRKLQAQDIADKLCDIGVNAGAIHGDLEQQERNEVLVQFSNKSCSVLVATDVAARGLDIKELKMVVNYDLPHDEETYTHRIGRTGRAGKEGTSITFFTQRETYKIDKYRNGSRFFEQSENLQDAANFTLKAPNVTLIINGGKKDKLRPGDILGALTGDAGIDKKFIGKIDIYDRKSYVALDKAKIEEANSQLKNGKIKGRKFYVTILR